MSKIGWHPGKLEELERGIIASVKFSLYMDRKFPGLRGKIQFATEEELKQEREIKVRCPKP